MGKKDCFFLTSDDVRAQALERKERYGAEKVGSVWACLMGCFIDDGTLQYHFELIKIVG